MITEDYVSFETAKLLKEKGFDIPCNCYGTYNGINLTYRLCITDKYTNWNKHSDSFIISCPTLQMAMKWLREIYRLHITVFSSSQESWMFRITKQHQNLEDGVYGEDFCKYEEACEAAITYCLENLI